MCVASSLVRCFLAGLAAAVAAVGILEVELGFIVFSIGPCPRLSSMHLLRVSMGCSSLSSTATWIETDNIDCLEPRGLYIPVQSLDVADVALVPQIFLARLWRAKIETSLPGDARTCDKLRALGRSTPKRQLWNRVEVILRREHARIFCSSAAAD